MIFRRTFLIYFNNSALRARSPSPDIGENPGQQAPTQDENHFSPKQPLALNPRYEYHIKLDELGPKGQYVYYQSNQEASEQSEYYIRMGIPFYLERMGEELVDRNSKSSKPFLDQDLDGRIFDGRIFDGQHHQELHKRGNIAKNQNTLTLYSTPLASDKTLNLTDPKIVRDRYLQKTERSRYCSPQGTLYKILADTCVIQKMKPAKPISEKNKKKIMGKRTYKACKGEEGTGNRTIIRIESMQMLTPTDISETGIRRWVY